MPNLADLSGEYFGYWRVIERAESTKRGKAKWLCECKCGTRKTVTGENLRNGESRSCGCLSAELSAERKRVHGQTGTRLYRIWNQMIQRTTNTNSPDYHDYGGRGISVCKEWKESFLVFERWAKENGYADNLTIDRKDNNKGYQPDNCRWSTIREQNRNTSRNHYLTYNGQTKTIMDWASEKGIKSSVLYERINKLGWTVERALETPAKSRSSKN